MSYVSGIVDILAVTNMIGFVVGMPILIYYTYGSFIQKVKEVYEEYGNTSMLTLEPPVVEEQEQEPAVVTKSLYQRLFDKLS